MSLERLRGLKYLLFRKEREQENIFDCMALVELMVGHGARALYLLDKVLLADDGYPIGPSI